MRHPLLLAVALAAFSTASLACEKPSGASLLYIYAAERMHERMPDTYTGDADVDFARGMIPHHQGAVEMAEVQLRYGKDPEMRALAKWILSTQQVEIAEMTHWLNVRGRNAARPDAEERPSTQEYRAAMERMHHDMHHPYRNDADVDFARGMIPHHQGAVEMAIVELRHGKNPELNRLAQNIIRSQRQEIAQMREWLEKNDTGGKENSTHH